MCNCRALFGSGRVDGGVEFTFTAAAAAGEDLLVFHRDLVLKALSAAVDKSPLAATIAGYAAGNKAHTCERRARVDRAA